MIGTHCDKPLVGERESKISFTKRCTVCGRRFTQRKRRPKS